MPWRIVFMRNFRAKQILPIEKDDRPLRNKGISYVSLSSEGKALQRAGRKRRPMKITDHCMAMSAERQTRETTVKRETLRIVLASPQAPADRITLSGQALKCQNCDTGLEDADAKARFEHSLKALLVEVLSGRKVRLLDPSDVTGEPKKGPDDASADQEIPQEEGDGWGLIYSHERTHREQEQVSLAARGVVRTGDGREIGFQLELNMSREFVEHHHLSIRAGDAGLVDPLVLNFGGTAAELSDFRFAFDLDGDGLDDHMPGLAPGSGYLALDRDENGGIDDGSELFGPGTGSGFQELAAYDDDKNGWIDESDGIFERLSLWEIGAQGERLSSLQDRGVGAIFLGSLEAPFDLKDETNQMEGRIARHGLFLEEDGTVGTVQELDVRV